MDYPDECILSDCLAGMRRVANDSADLIIADPPYNIGKNFGNNQDRMALSDYIAWAGKWIGECRRILKSSGTMFIYGFPEILAHISVSLPIDRQRWLQWHYANKNMPNLHFWQRSHESILCIWKDKPLFNRDDVREPYSESFLKGSAGRKRPAGACRLGRNGGRETVYNAHEKGALPRDVICVRSLAGGASLKERSIFCRTCGFLIEPAKRREHRDHELIIHPTQKPRELTRKLVLSCRPKGSFNVLVPFCGSGSECAVVKSLGGHFISYELNEYYITLAQAVLARRPFCP